MLKIKPVLIQYGIDFLLIFRETKPNITGYLANKRSAFANTDAYVGIHNDSLCCQSKLFPLPKTEKIFSLCLGSNVSILVLGHLQQVVYRNSCV